jgi:hypothetical protein
VFYGQLADGTLQQSVVEERDLQRVQARILQDLELMHVLDHYGRNVDTEVFPPCSLSGLCKSCVYQGICPGAAI